MLLLVGETPSQPGHFPILREQRDKGLPKSQSGGDKLVSPHMQMPLSPPRGTWFPSSKAWGLGSHHLGITLWGITTKVRVTAVS